MLAVWGFFAVNLATPGPNVLNTIGVTLGSGRRAGLAAALGVGPGVALWGASAVLAPGALFALWPGARVALTLIGSALLVWFGARYLRRALRPAGAAARARALTPKQAFTGSLAVLATNPKALTTWIMVLSLFPVEAAGGGATAVMVGGMVVLAVGMHAIYAVAFSTRAAAAAYARAARGVDGAVGAMFVALGAGLATDALLR